MDKLTARLIIGLVIDALIANGYLLPEQRDKWVDGVLQISGSIGALMLVLAWHHNAHKTDPNPTEQAFSLQNVFAQVRKFAFKPPLPKPTDPIE